MYGPPLSAHNLEPTRYIDPTYSAPYAPGLVEHQFPKAYNIIIALCNVLTNSNPACVLSPDFARYRPGYVDQPPVDPTFDLAYHIVGRLALPGFLTSSGFFPFFAHSATADHFRHLIAKHINGRGCSGVRPIVLMGSQSQIATAT
eukprot:gene6861-30837_t